MPQPKTLTLLNLTGTATDTNGTWIYVGNIAAPFSVHVTGAAAGDTVVINTSCSPTAPAAATHHVQEASVTADGITTISKPVAWIKARKAAATQSSAVWLHGHFA